MKTKRNAYITTLIICFAVVIPSVLLQWYVRDSVFYKYQIGTISLMLGAIVVSITQFLKRNNFSIKTLIKKNTSYFYLLLLILFIATVVYVLFFSRNIIWTF